LPSTGTCWGSYANLRLSGHFKELKAAVSLHPAHHGMIQGLGEDEREILEAAKGVPQVQNMYLSKTNRNKITFVETARVRNNVRQLDTSKKE
jgi:hypothetical protein